VPLIIDGGRVPPHWLEKKAPALGSSGIKESECVRVALINNMPDAALEDTELQFCELLDEASGDLPVVLKLYSLSGIPRTTRGMTHVNAFYFPINDLWNSECDGVIFTGTEPLQRNLRNEPYWSSLTSVLDWTQSNTTSTILSCLAAHAGVLHWDGIERHPLPDKQCGVFEFSNSAEHELTRAIGDVVRFPHSRWNEVREDQLAANGYQILTHSVDGGVDTFIRKRERSLFVHFQGHPEYGPLTLLKEYRRDIRRFIHGDRETYPSMPKGYLDASSTKLAIEFQETAISDRRADVLTCFPQAELTNSLRHSWHPAAISIYRNWIGYLLSGATNFSEAVTVPVSNHQVARRSILQAKLVERNPAYMPFIRDNAAIEPSTERSARICDVVEHWASVSPEHPALVDSTGIWTYGQFLSAISEAELWLRDFGVRAGDRVMIVGDNCKPYAAILLAANRLDAWPVPVNAHLSHREVDTIRDHCRPRLVVYTPETSLHAGEHADRHSAVSVEVSTVGLIRVAQLNEAQCEQIDQEISNRVAALIYTSGTTGNPKGVMLTHKNLLFAARGAAKIRSLTQDDRIYCAMPFSHVVGLSSLFLSTLLSGATLYVAARFDPMTARLTLENDRITVMLGVPAMFSQFLQYAKLRKIDKLDLPDLRIISCSGAPLPANTKSSVENLFGLTLHHAYGVTECSPNIAQVRIDRPPCHDTSVGPVFPGMEIKLVGAAGDCVPQGEIGELKVRGPNVMKGYYRAPDETAAVLDRDGWFNTRDLARQDGDNLYIVGRTKELIIRRGFNVYPAEVEAVLNAHPAVYQSGVVGRTLEADEEVVAFLQLLPNSTVSVTELSEYAARHLASYKRPSEIIILANMPTTATGKVAKNELADLIRRGVGA